MGRKHHPLINRKSTFTVAPPHGPDAPAAKVTESLMPAISGPFLIEAPARTVALPGACPIKQRTRFVDSRSTESSTHPRRRHTKDSPARDKRRLPRFRYNADMAWPTPSKLIFSLVRKGH